MEKPAAFPNLPERIEDPQKLAALGHVLGCTSAMGREILRGRDAETALWERIEALERAVSTLTTLLLTKK